MNIARAPAVALVEAHEEIADERGGERQREGMQSGRAPPSGQARAVAGPGLPSSTGAPARRCAWRASRLQGKKIPRGIQATDTRADCPAGEAGRCPADRAARASFPAARAGKATSRVPEAA